MSKKDENVTLQTPKEETSPSIAIEQSSEPLTAKQINDRKIQKFAEEESKLVRGVFRNYETPSGSLRVQIRKYPNIPPFDMTMEDGREYEVPLYVARHLNGIDVVAGKLDGKIGSCSYAVHGYTWNEAAPVMSGSMSSMASAPVPIVGITSRVRRFGFESMQFHAAR